MRGTISLRAVLALLAGLAIALFPLGAATAGDLYWTGTGDWDTTSQVWGTSSGGPYDQAIWNNGTPDSAIFEGTAGTVTLTEPISIQSMTFNQVGNYTITGQSLNFSGGVAAYDIFNSVNNVDQTITSAITGSPTVGVASNTSQDFGLMFAPTGTDTQTLGTITMAVEDGSGDKCAVTLGGSSTGNSVASVGFDAGHRWANLRINSTGSWTVGDIDNGTVEIQNGDFYPTGTIYTRYRGIELKGGTLHYNTPILVTGGSFNFQGGSLDNTSGAPVAVPATDGGGSPVYQPAMNWKSSFTFIGSNGANSDLDLGTGAVTLSSDITVTVQNAATTLTVGGVVSNGATPYDLTKNGDGTLALTGNNTYGGDTKVEAGTLTLAQACLADSSSLYMTTGATLNLLHSETDTILALFIDDVLQAAGTYDSSYAWLTGTGSIFTTGGVAPADTYFWDGPSSGGIGDAASDGGTGTWSTAVDNWDVGITARQAWNNATGATAKAILAGAGGTITVDGDITVKEILMDASTTGNYTIEGGTLNFAPGGYIDQAAQPKVLTITSGITGDPNAGIASYSHNPHNVLYLAPEAGKTQHLGIITNPYNDGNGGDKGYVVLGGDTTGNTVQSIVWDPTSYAMHYGVVEKEGTGTWTVAGDVKTGRFYVGGGVLSVGGEINLPYDGMRVGVKRSNWQASYTPSGSGTLTGNFTVYSPDRRASQYVYAGGTIAPGDGVGTATFDWGTGGSPGASEDDYSLVFYDDSIYEWQIGDGETDTIHLAHGRLFLHNMKLKILDAGAGTIGDGDHLAVFTYDDGVAIDITAFGNTETNFDVTELDSSWIIGTLELVDDGNGTVFLTGLSNGLQGDINGDGFVDAADYILLKQNFGQSSGSSAVAEAADLDGSGIVGIGDLDLLAGYLNAAGGAAVTPEPATLALLAFGGLAVVRRRRN